jgi:putative transposase
MSAEGLPIQVACRVLAVSESGYHAWRTRPPSARAVRHALLTDLIVEIHAASRGVYGARRVHAELTLGRGVQVGHGAVELLMHRAGLQGLSGRPKFHKIANVASASDRVERSFGRSERDQLWVTDIERHEAFLNPAVMKGHRRVLVAAGALKLRAA